MYKALLYLIMLLHALLVMFIILTPFFAGNYLLLLHAIIIPFILLHWVLNNNTCALTILEYKIREYINGGPVNRDQCFMARLIDPVYDFKKNHNDRRKFLYISMILLWGISVYKLIRNVRNGTLSSLQDLVFK